MKTRSSDYLIAFGILSVLMTGYVVAALWIIAEPSAPLLSLSMFVSVCLVALWVDADSRGRREIYRPFEYGWLVYVYWIPYVPYYLWRTRRAKGLLAFAGILFLLLSWWIAWAMMDFLRS
jgi:hypothetical protein